MNILVLIPARQNVACSIFDSDNGLKRIFAGSFKLDELDSHSSGISRIFARIKSSNRHCSDTDSSLLIAIRTVFGGSMFSEPVIIDENKVEQLKKLISGAPLHIPGLIHLIENCNKIFPKTPKLLFSETAFFTNLPEREHLYALDEKLIGGSRLRRFGMHGLFHEEACGSITGNTENTALRLKIISICLNDNPEIAAAIGLRPVMTTGSSSYLEDLPGRTTCGAIDPAIILALSEKYSWGPDKINSVLTKDSGIFGLTGENISLQDLFHTDKEGYLLAQNLIKYHILQACGAAAAAMGGVDAIIFSGIYNDIGKILGPWIKSHLLCQNPVAQDNIMVHICSEPLDLIIAKKALSQSAVETSAV